MAVRGCLIRIRMLSFRIFESDCITPKQYRGISDQSESTVSTSKKQESSSDQRRKIIVPMNETLPEEPTNCCMSGCANCVWIKYAEDLVNCVDGGNDLAREVIMEKVQDPNMKAFLAMELKTIVK